MKMKLAFLLLRASRSTESHAPCFTRWAGSALQLPNFYASWPLKAVTTPNACAKKVRTRLLSWGHKASQLSAAVSMKRKMLKRGVCPLCLSPSPHPHRSYATLSNQDSQPHSLS